TPAEATNAIVAIARNGNIRKWLPLNGIRALR
ncbi:MAG: hypothetical protein QOK12_1392, partial [Mycobacterium sp.]|nr:hypothetical protein [Mycobacterium sp.]